MASTINSTQTGNGGLISTGDDSGVLNIQTNETTAVTIDASQNVGIGTSSPAAKLHVSSANVPSRGQLTIEGSDTVQATWYKGATIQAQAFGDGTQFIFGTSQAIPLIFRTDSAERARIDSSGNLLVGCTSFPSASVAGYKTSANILTGATTSSTGSSTSAIAHYQFINGNGTVGQIYTSGSTTTFATSSDYRLKENIAPMTGALSVVAALKPCTYNWKVDGSNGQGFIAHELQAVVPDCVTGEKDAVDAEGNPVHQGIDTSFLVATLTAAIQELKTINDTQAQAITTLTERITALEAK